MGVIKNKKWFFIFLLPGLLFYILSVFYPIEESIRLSFMDGTELVIKLLQVCKIMLQCFMIQHFINHF